MAAKELVSYGKIVGHEVMDETEAGGKPLKVTLRTIGTVKGEVFKGKATLIVNDSDRDQYPLGATVLINVKLSQTEIAFNEAAP